MEKFSGFRDRGTQIAPFLPISGPRSTLQTVCGVFIFLLRLPFFLSIAGSYLLVVRWLPVGSLIRKAWLWSILGVCGVWWVDLQVEGVRRGSLARQATKLPGPGSIIISSYTSPLDAIYLAAIFDPIFTTSYPTTKLVERVSLPMFLWRYFTAPALHPAESANMVSLPELLRKKPNCTIVLFPEATPTNGRGILRFTPALSTAPPATKIFPISLRYSPPDITTPVPNALFKFLWSLLSRPTHCIRVRIAETIYNDGAAAVQRDDGDDDDGDDDDDDDYGLAAGGDDSGDAAAVDEHEALGGVCERGSEALARIGRIKRLNLGVRDKIGFVQAWKRRNGLMG